MYYVLIEFDVRPGREDGFIEAWSELTEIIHRESGGLGSRLHTTPDGRYIAYAQWPDKETRERDSLFSDEGQRARELMRETIVPENTRILYELSLVKDLLK